MSTWDLNHINLEDKIVLMKIKDPNLGFAITFLITELKRKHMVKSTQLVNFYNDVINIIICIIQKLFQKRPLGYVVKNAVIFDWNIMVSSTLPILILKIDLSFLIKITLILSYEQSALEKNFCISNSIPNVQIKEESIVAKTFVKSHISPRH